VHMEIKRLNSGTHPIGATAMPSCTGIRNAGEYYKWKYDRIRNRRITSPEGMLQNKGKSKKTPVAVRLVQSVLNPP